MATKAELEQEVEQLKQQLASEKPDLAAMQAELDKLKSDLDACVDERDALRAELGKADAANELAEELIRQSGEDRAKLVQQLADVQGQLVTLQISGTKDHVMLDGIRYDINWRSTVKDVVYEGYHKKNLDENHTALVVSKHGG